MNSKTKNSILNLYEKRGWSIKAINNVKKGISKTKITEVIKTAGIMRKMGEAYRNR